ncbi:unnamed protein product [Zymoseptoria tritici ST99CH_1A5]|uniref:Dicer-like protein 1 n=4 Tax=Zymoseptoria tritici TaxID=1047171 RepID=A0A1X7S3L7_ZYMT9|nr:unnamed protein product [Zymoseptoria tritici ST99CH_3D7]SMR58700.1 unnamed protein product [Zymoseptoria tritici ST99CH_1E4]SMY27911.1 unnamed protein product [Zymoseptoria tritici ST99CH_1A5]
MGALSMDLPSNPPSMSAPSDLLAEEDAEANDSGAEEDPLPPGAPVSLVEKRRLQKAVFEHWITTPACQEALKPKHKDGKTKGIEDEEQSIHSLLAQQQKGVQIVKNPREYQIELFERAKKENTIAVLDTGSGKTLIAVLLLRWMIDNELEDRAAGKPSRVSFFLVSSVTLVYQQHSVLECNLDHKVARLCGADNVDRFNKSSWEKLFYENKVIVCTAEILFQCLSRSYITMKQINLLIFDEAHHAKQNHPFARIVKDFYLTEPDATSCPRVFGMTASPIDAKTDVVQAASELETLLGCRIATTSDMSLAESIKKPKECVLQYDALPQTGAETLLLQSLKARYGHVEVFNKTFEQATDISRVLGRWCADSHLVDALGSDKLKKLEATVERRFYARDRSQAADSEARQAELERQLKELRDAVAYVQEQATSTANLATVTADDVSSKVWSLRGHLDAQFERPSNHRCIVFVDQRYTARLLTRLFQKIGTKHLHSQFLIGHGSGNADEGSFTFRQQVWTLLKFRKGVFNCLFATSVAEEGLDVPDCNLVVRFDMYKTMIQYVQSRGRARNINSTFIHMLEMGNSIQTNLLNEVRHQEKAMRDFCNLLPADRKLDGNQDGLNELLEKEKNTRTYTVPATGAKLTYGNALSILAHFVSAVPSDSDEPQHPTCVISVTGQKFLAEVLLPGNSPIRSVLGRPEQRKQLAKCSAAFNACLELRKKEYLDAHLMPIYQKKLPAMRNALLATGMDKTKGFAMQVKPKIWAEQRGIVPSQLWITLVDFPQGLDRPHRSFAMLTRSSILQLPKFPVFPSIGKSSDVVSASLSRPLEVTSQLLAKLTAFTLRIFLDVFSKTYEEDDAKLSYWLVPTTIALHGDEASKDRIRSIDPREVIDWNLVESVFDNKEHKWTPGMPNDFLANKFITDPWDGSRKFYSKAVDGSLRQTDDLPSDVVPPRAKWTGKTIMDYSVRLWKNADKKSQWHDNQPVIEAEKVLLRRNMLASPDQQEVSVSTKAYICPEPLRISAIPPELATSLLFWPAVIHRIEAYLISIEGSASVGVACDPTFALAAFTKDSDNQGEHEAQERVNFQRGMGENYERLEFIGDTFLKTATTISTFIQNPNDNEFEFHVRRMQMLCNKNLFEHALEYKLYEYIRSMAFNRRTWYPEGMKLMAGTGVIKGQEKEMYHSEMTHVLGKKTIADVCEALIGAAFLTHNQPDEKWQPHHWEPAIQAVTKLVKSDDHTMLTMDDYKAAYLLPDYQTAHVTAVQRDLAEKIQLEHAYSFNYPRLLYSAFSHPSNPYMHAQVPNYQRLEFLGDALLDQASISYLFYKFPAADPQWLTEHKMAMVSNKFLGALCVNIGFHKHLRHSHSSLGKQIHAYVDELVEARTSSGPDCRDYWTTVSDPPKCLPDVIESFVGAMFIDSNFNFAEVQRFFEEHVKWYFEDMSIYDTFANNHPCTHLHQRLQTGFGCMDYRLMAKELPNVEGGAERKDVVAVVMIHDRIVASSGGKSGRYARLRVANRALEVLDGLAPFEFREKFGCVCKGVEDSGEVITVGADCGV